MRDLQKVILTRYFQIILLLYIASVITSGCALIQLNKEVKQGQASTVIVGRVASAFPGDGPIVVVAYTKNHGKREVAHYTILHDFGEYELMVAKGDYYVFAYRDKDSNLIYDAGEPAGQHGNPKIVRAPAGGVVGGIDIIITEKGREIEIPTGFEVSTIKPEKFYSRLAGATLDLEDERFAEQHGSKGFWEPFSFFKEYGGNIYFLEPYDPQKIPILFIHGAAGTPKGWKYIVDSIDRTRFQPWFFYYPSGARIRSMSLLLNWKLGNLQRKYHFDQFYITAHSMGGLVARSYIMDYGTEPPLVKLFISMATPWGGVKMAEYGVKQSPAVIPCWIDMQPESAFIQSLYRSTMPKYVDFYMFYGHSGSRNPFRSNNDGTIAMSSLLDRRPQAEAKMNYAFNEDHASIIYSKEVVDQYNTIINAVYENKSASLRQSGGYLKLHFSYDDSFIDEKPWPTLILEPSGKDDAETIISLNANNSGKILGPLLPGNYLASLVSAPAKPSKRQVPVTIKGNQTSELHYALTSDGIFAGNVTSAFKPKDWTVGMPRERITPQSISLTGPGVHRMVHLIENNDVNLSSYYIQRKDFYHDGLFIVFGLPAGEYELVIKANGYHTFVEKYVVAPGKRVRAVPLELVPQN